MEQQSGRGLKKFQELKVRCCSYICNHLHPAHLSDQNQHGCNDLLLCRTSLCLFTHPRKHEGEQEPSVTLKSQTKDGCVFARVCVCSVLPRRHAWHLGRPCRRPSGGIRCGRCSGPGLWPSDTSGSSLRCSGCSCPRRSAALRDTNGLSRRKQKPPTGPPPSSGPEPRHSSGLFFLDQDLSEQRVHFRSNRVSKLGGRLGELGGVSLTTVVVRLLVGSVSAVVDFVADFPLADAASVPTLELVRGTRGALCVEARVTSESVLPAGGGWGG